MSVGEQKIQAKVPRKATAIPLRSLGEKQLLTVKKAASLVERGSVLVGALPGSSLDDLRPLFLLEGRVHVLRVVRPIDGMQAVQALFKTLRTNTMAGAQFSSDDERFWYIRPFFQTLLWESEAGSLQWNAETVQNAVEGVFTDFLKFCNAGGLHGGVAPQNVAVNDKRLVLVDAGGYLLSKGVSGDGLKISDGKRVLQEADFAGLARVLLDYFSSPQLGPIEAFLKKICELPVGQGAILSEVAARFSPAQELPKRPGIISAQAPAEEVSAAKGKILPGGMAVVPQAENAEKQPQDTVTPPPKAEPEVIALTEDTVVVVEPVPFADIDVPAEEIPKKKPKPTAQEVLAWAEIQHLLVVRLSRRFAVLLKVVYQEIKIAIRFLIIQSKSLKLRLRHRKLLLPLVNLGCV